jgi:hypothetical protein
MRDMTRVNAEGNWFFSIKVLVKTGMG